MKKIILFLLTLALFVTLSACGETDQTDSTASDIPVIRLQDYTYEKIDGGIRIQFYKGFDEHVTIPDTIDGLPVVEIGPSAFDGRIFLATVVIPDTVTKIGFDAFKDCSLLTKVTLPDGLQELGARAFENCVLLTDITLPDGVQFVGEDAFAGCTSLSNPPKSTQ